MLSFNTVILLKTICRKPVLVNLGKSSVSIIWKPVKWFFFKTAKPWFPYGNTSYAGYLSVKFFFTIYGNLK